MPDRDLMTRLNEASPELTRRSLLKWAAAGAGAASFGPMIGRLQAFAAPPVGPRDGILVLIQMSGGNDGLNTLCPIGDGRYYDLRGGLAVAPQNALSVGSGLGLHPALAHLKHRYDLGQVAIVRGVGYTPPDLSHFTSMGTWMQGWAGAAPAPTGWAGRIVDNFPDAASEGLYAVTIGSSVPPHLVGAVSRASGLPLNISGAFAVDRSNANDRRMFDAISSFGSGSSALGPWGDLVGSTESRLMTLTQEIQPAYQGPVPQGDLEQQLTLCARLINANLGIRILNTEIGSFDTHTDQASTQAGLFADLDAGIEAFFANLNPAWADRVTLLTFSEFGRRPEANDGAGTDHGTASVVFVVGSRVNGGLHGVQPSLAANGLDQYGNLVEHVDFRNIYADIVSKWFGADEVEVVGKNYSSLSLFRAGPGTAAPPATPTQTSGNGYWIATSTGVISSAGHAPAKPGLHGLAAAIVGGDVTPTDRGFWLVASDGGIFSFGDARFHGSTGAMHLNKAIVGMAATPTGKGYWLVASDGGIFSFGDARFHGSTGGMHLNQSIVGLAATPTGRGYWLVASDGGIFCFGDAGFHGAAAGSIPASARVLRRTGSGHGYWILAADGTVRTFGDAPNYGSARAPGAVAFLPAHS